MEPEPAVTTAPAESAGNAPATPTSAAKKRLPTTAWMVYLAEHRDALAKENPGLPFTEVTKLLGERYRQLDAESKKQLAEIADANRAATRDEKTQQEPVKAKAKEPVVAGEKYSSMDLTMPVARVKRTVQLDPEVARVSGDAVLLVAKAAEFFLEHFALRVAQMTTAAKRRTTKMDDIVEAIHSTSPYAFLRWDFPKTMIQKPAKKSAASTAASKRERNVADTSRKAGLKAFFTTNAADEKEDVGEAPEEGDEHADDSSADNEVEAEAEAEEAEEEEAAVEAEAEGEEANGVEDDDESDEEPYEEEPDEAYEEPTPRRQAARKKRATKQPQPDKESPVTPSTRRKKQRT